MVAGSSETSVNVRQTVWRQDTLDSVVNLQKSTEVHG